MNSTPYANSQGRVPLRDCDREANPPPEYDDERDPAGCTLFMMPLLIFAVAGLGWLFGF